MGPVAALNINHKERSRQLKQHFYVEAEQRERTLDDSTDASMAYCKTFCGDTYCCLFLNLQTRLISHKPFLCW